MLQWQPKQIKQLWDMGDERAEDQEMPHAAQDEMVRVFQSIHEGENLMVPAMAQVQKEQEEYTCLINPKGRSYDF